jgi:hypothetical protein
MILNNYTELSIEKEGFIDKACYNQQNIFIFKFFETKDELLNGWEDSQTFVAGNIQSKLKELGLSENLIWNFYLVFYINFEIDEQIKSQIESDKFCCKKYVVYIDNINDDNVVNQALENQIPLFSNINFGEEFIPISSSDAVKKKIFDKTNKSSLARMFLGTDNIQDITQDEQFGDFINNLMDSYTDEN